MGTTHSDRPTTKFFSILIYYIFLFILRLLCFATGCVGERFRGQARTPNLRLGAVGASTTITNTQGVKYVPVCPPTHPSV